MRDTPFILWICCILGGYLLGGLMFCRIIPQFFLNVDICENSDDHNPGASNVFLQCGIGWGLLCLFLDLLKGFLPVCFGCRLLNHNSFLFSLVLAAPVLGHATAPFFHFQGGKCIATSFGVLFALFPYNKIGILLAIFYIIFSTIIKIRPNRIRSILTYSIFGVLAALILFPKQQYAIALGCILISAIVILKHSKYVSEIKQKAYSK